MRRHLADEQIDRWQRAHRGFHQLTTEGAPMLHDSICSLGERAERFLRLAQLGHPTAWARWDEDHETLVKAFRERNHDLAVQTIAEHLARTAFTAMADIAPHRDAAATRTALNLLLSEEMKCNIGRGTTPLGSSRKPAEFQNSGWGR